MANQLTISFTAALPAPSDGYLVRYWETSTPATVLTKTVTASPAVITGLAGYNYTVTIESVCIFANSTRVSFTDAVCNVTFNISSTAPTNQGGTNGTATISNIVGGSGTYTYSWNTSPVQTTLTATGLVAGQTYVATVTDTITSCVTTGNIVVGQTNFTFDADFMVITYEFTSGTDLDTRTRIVSIDGTTYTDQNAQGKHMGWNQYKRTPQTATYPSPLSPASVCTLPIKPLAMWGEDNTGQGFETVMVDFTQLGAGQNEVIVDCRAFWYGSIGNPNNAVNLSFTLYKGGCMIMQGSAGSPRYSFTNPTATSSLAGASASKVITAYRNVSTATGSADLESPNVDASLTRGQRLAVIKYNRSTNVGSIDINNTTTPVV
jgi:hypothetical protein